MKTILDILIGLVGLVVIVGVVAVGYVFYQRSQEENSTIVQNTTITTNATVSASTVPIACSEGERRIINNLLVEFDEWLFRELSWLEHDTIQTLQDLTTTVPDMHRANSLYYDDFYPRFPTCAEGYVIRDIMGFGYESVEEFLATSVLSVYVQQFGDATTHNALVLVSERRDQMQKNLPDEVAYTTALQEGNIYPNGMPECGPGAPGELAKYDPIVNEFRQLYPQYTSFIETRSGDFFTLLRFEELALEAAELDTVICYENFSREVQINQLLMDTTLAIHIAQLAAFENRRGNFTISQNLERIVDFHHNRVLTNVTQVLSE